MGYENMTSDRNTERNNHLSALSGDKPLQYPECAVAVVGVACRYAGADSEEQLWQIFEEGTTKITGLPKERLPDFRFERRPFKRDFRASILSDLDAFDHKFFNVPSHEAKFRDPQQRFALEVTYQALESAGYLSREIAEAQLDMGCYFSTAMNEYHEHVVTHAPSAFSLTGSIRPFIAGQVSHHFGFTGPAVMIDAACAASGVAINIACRAVASGECRSAIAGGTNVFISPDTFQDLTAGHFICATGPSKSFDAAADGYCRGEGVAAVVLKRLSDALEDGDVIKGVISATAVNQCANACPITVPHGPTQSSLYRKALRMAHMDASQIGYVEAHGTGTRVGDPIEVESIRSVFGDPSYGRVTTTYLGSHKSNIGHTEASSGLAGLIKVMLMIEKGIIPQQAVFRTLNPEIPPLEPSGLAIPTQNIPWTSKYRAACVNNYGASGCNAVMIVTPPPTPATKEPVPYIDAYPISITAFSHTSLKLYCAALLDFMDQVGASDALALDVAYHLSRSRNPELPFSATATISNLKGLKDLLTVQSETPQRSEYSKRPTVLFFGGQTGRIASVSRAVYESCAVFRKHLNDCEAAIQALSCPSMFPGIFEPDSSESSILTHSKLFSVQYASARSWMDSGVQPARLIGHSFGQLTALCVSGALSLNDTLRLVINRARLIDEIWVSDAGSMLAVEATPNELSGILARHPHLSLEIACYNGPHSCVLAGTTSTVVEMEAILKSPPQTYRFKRLQVPNAFHSALADPVVDPLQRIAEGLTPQKPNIMLETCSEDSTWASIKPSLVASHIRTPVYFHQAVQRIAEQLGPCVWIEAGSGGNASLLRRALEPKAFDHEIKSLKIDASSSLKSLADFTTGLWRSNLKIQFWPFHPDQRHQFQTLNLPPYQFDKTRHWLGWKELDVQPVADMTTISKPSPLLHLVRKTHNESEFQIDTQCESWRAKSAEHRLLGFSTCAMSLIQDLLCEAIGIIQEASTQRPNIYRVENLEMPRPIPAEIDDVLDMTVSLSATPQSWRFRLTQGIDARHEFARGTACTGQEISKVISSALKDSLISLTSQI
ncbi:MAG: hypothetical protein Q9159_006087 [Coniocarpon cinnabarinum]